MTTLFPISPSAGKNAKVYMNTGDGTLLTMQAMTLQATKTYRGKLYTNQIYLLGSGKTLINMRPEVQPDIDIDGILQGLDILPVVGDQNTVQTTAGIIEVDGAQVSVPADADIELTRPAASRWAWYAIHVSEAGAVTATKGTDTGDDQESSLLNTYGSSAGQRPLIGVDQLLIGWVKLFSNVAADVAATAISYTDREEGGIDFQILPNIGGVKLNGALVKCHTGAIGREVKFTGRYLDGVLAEIPTAKSFSLTAQTSQLNEETFANNYGSTTTGGFNFAYEQLAADTKAINNVWNRESHCAVKLMWPNGFFMQFVGSISPNLNVNATAMSNISVSGSCGDFPARSDEM